MKKKLFIKALTVCLLLTLFSCTPNQRVRQYGGEMTINLPKGQKLMMATWKKANLFYLTEPMESDYVPKNKVFQESSNWGVLESKIIFVESR